MFAFYLAYLRTLVRHFIKDERGATMVEYGLILGLIAVVLIAVLTALGGDLKGLFQHAADSVKDAGSGG